MGLLKLMPAWTLAVVLVGCASTPRWEKYAAPPVGTTWTNQIRNSGSFSGPAEVSSRMGQMMWNGEPHIAFHNGPNTLVARADGSWVTILGADGKSTMSFEPPTPLGWPLEVGKTWKASFKVVNHANNTTTNVEASYVIEAYEPVTVGAGSFNTFRLRMTNNLGEDNTWWFCQDNGLFVKQRLVRGDRFPAGAGLREVELKTLSLAK